MKNKFKKIIGKIFSIIFILSIIFVIFYFVYDLFNPLKKLLLEGNEIEFENKLSEYGIWKYIVMILLNTFQVFLTIMPGEPIQLLSGIICDKYLGFLVCIIGVFIGNTVLYLLVNFFNFTIKDEKFKKNEEYQNLINKNTDDDMNSFTLFILGLYFAPIIPYGVIAYTAAKNKMKFPRYILTTTLGIIPSVLICIATSSIIVDHNIFKLTNLIPALIIGFVLLILVIFIIKYKKKVLEHILNRSIRATIIWVIPFVILFILLCFFFLTGRNISCAITLLILIAYIIMYIIFNAKVAGLFTKKKMKDFQADVEVNQHKFLYTIFDIILIIFSKIKYRIHINRNGIKKLNTPSIVLFNHGSSIDFLSDWAFLYPQRGNMVAAYYYFCNFHLGRLMHFFGAFPKFLYQPDISAIKNMKKVLRNNGILFLAPEGRLTPHGELESFIPSTVKFLKKECCDVYLFKNHGTYFTKPKWAKTSRKGRVDVDYIHLFTKEELKVLTLEEIYNKLYENLYYDEYKWMEENKVKFKGRKFAEGLEQLFYYCPVCGHEYTYSSNKATLECSHCHTKVTLNPYYELVSSNPKIPKTIKEWYNLQKRIELQNIQDPNYVLKTNVYLKNPDPKGLGFIVTGKGECTLTHEGIRYVGTKNNENVDILFRLENMPALPFGVNEDFEIYHDQTLYYFIPENIRECAKWSVVEEQMYEDLMNKKGVKPVDR